jgi:xanthine dehydrogenase accessory factor
VDLDRVCQFLHDSQQRGLETVLVTVCAVEGSSMRNPGTIMGVAQDGSFAGSLSGGCIENAVVAEALDTLTAGTPRLVRFGADSPYLDIRLPCGGGLDLQFQPLGDTPLAAQCLASIRGRAPFAIAIGPGGAEHMPGWRAPAFDAQAGSATFGHWPVPRLQIIGHGAGVEALASMARTFGCATRVLTPDQRIIAALGEQAIHATLLQRTGQTELLLSDRWTANVFLFHDHDWETELLEAALASPHFYLGAMGGRQAHVRRCAALAARGVGEEQLAAVHAPIGLFHSSRDPHTLALSTLAEVIRTYDATDFASGHH